MDLETAKDIYSEGLTVGIQLGRGLTDGLDGVLLRFTLPLLPPSANNLYRNAARGRRKTEVYARWIDSMGLLLNTQVAAARANGADLPHRGLVDIAYQLLLGDPSRRKDLGNYEKALTDLLVRCQALEDDYLVQRLALGWVAGPAPAVVGVVRRSQVS